MKKYEKKAKKLEKQRETNKHEKTHNRQKNYILNEGELIPPLIDMGIFTHEGKIASSMQHKYRQINRYLEIINDTLTDDMSSLKVIDFGCGKSYLTFIVYYFLTEIKGLKVEMIGLDLKEDVINHCTKVAEKYGYTGLTFKTGDVQEDFTKIENNIDMIISLHACDTATDYALFQGIKLNAKIILAAPCCQHELNSQIKSNNLSLFTRYGIIKERIAALTTDAIRANLMASRGYKTQVMEFVELSHTPKNLLIRAIKTNMPNKARNMYLAEVEEICDEFSLTPLLDKLLKTLN